MDCMDSHGRRSTDLTPELAAKAARRRRWLEVLGTVAVLLIAGGAFVLSLSAQNAAGRATHTQELLRAASFGACERVNALRSNDNKLAESHYETLLIAGSLVEFRPRLARRFRRLAMTVDFIPLTVCQDAVGTPALYTPPTPHPIHRLTAEERLELRQKGSLR